VGNNVLAHVPDINDFVHGLKMVLSENGTITMEFPHILKLIQFKQFDTIYHEHFSYLSLTTVERIFQSHGLTIYDVEELPTHGGSLRIYACHNENKSYAIGVNVESLKNQELEFGLLDMGVYSSFQKKADAVKHLLLSYLLKQRMTGKRIAAYGAAAKGNTFLNYCGIKGTDLINFVVDASPHKQGKYLPGSHIPIVSEQKIKDEKPDIIVTLPWNLKEEITDQLSYANDWGCKFVLGIPELKEIKRN